jgi:hypothetical protein
MVELTRKEQIERRLEQSRRLLTGACDHLTCERISKLIGELELERRVELEK